MNLHLCNHSLEYTSVLSNSDAFVSELLKNLEEMLPPY